MVLRSRRRCDWLCVAMRVARRTPLVLVTALLTVLVLAVPARTETVKKTLHDGTVISCRVSHTNIFEDVVAFRIREAKADRKVESKLKKDVAVEAAVALIFLSQSNAHPRAVVDGSDKGVLKGKKGIGDYEMTFNSFGTYQVNIKLTAKGFKPATDSFKFQVTDTNGGDCKMVP